MNEILNAKHVATPGEVLPGAGMSSQEMAEKGITKERLLKESGGVSLTALINSKKNK